MEIGKKIKQLRLYKGVTQETLAEALNVTYQAVSKWENGSSSPDIGLLPSLSAYFGITIDDLFTLSGNVHLKRIENMLERQQHLSDEDQTYGVRQLQDMLDKNVEPDKAHGLLACLYNKIANQYSEKASVHAQKAIELEPNEKMHHVAYVEAERGVQSDWNTSNHHKIVAYYQDFTKRHPNHRSGYLWLLDHLIAAGRLFEAQTALDELRNIDSGYIGHIYSGKLEKALGHTEKAMAQWQLAVSLHPDNWQSHFCLADEKVRLGLWQEALADYETAYQLQPRPKFYDALECQAYIYEVLGDNDRAISKRHDILTLLKEDWQVTFGELADQHTREIQRLQSNKNSTNIDTKNL